MESWFVVVIAIAFVVGIVLGWSAHKQENENDRNTAELNAVLRADLKYVKRGIEELRRELRLQRQMLCDCQDAQSSREQSEPVQENSLGSHKEAVLSSVSANGEE